MQQYFYALTGSTKIQISHTHRQFAKVCAFQGIWIHNIFKSCVEWRWLCRFCTAISHGGNIFKWHAPKCHKLVVLHDILYMQHPIPASFNLHNSFTLNGSFYLTSSWKKVSKCFSSGHSHCSLSSSCSSEETRSLPVSVLLNLAPVDGKS